MRGLAVGQLVRSWPQTKKASSRLAFVVCRIPHSQVIYDIIEKLLCADTCVSAEQFRQLHAKRFGNTLSPLECYRLMPG